MEVTIRKGTVSDASIIQSIAYKTWPLAYGEILSPCQLTYMLNIMYSMEELELLLSGDCHSLIAEDELKVSIGFAVFTPVENVPSTFHLNKIYVLPGYQRHHCGKSLLEAVIRSVKNLNGQILTLNVNRQNKARYFYEKMGFTILRQEDIDIGYGYFMNDFVMGKNLY